jgi:chorismate--pyruvate lyase|tara:strand:- start:1088 stop:1741 length:654 start_codon:yes stop_codon:yes gene_type:complete
LQLSNTSLVQRLQSRKRILAEPRWRPEGLYTRKTLPRDLRGWLTDSGSLTARLIASDQGQFSVKRLYQGWEVPLLSEQRLLDLPPRQLALVREVALLLDDSAVVFARSIFPITSLNGSLAHLRRLQNKSLGAFLFKHPGMHRYPFELSRMAGNSDYLPDDLRQPEPAWGRRCRFEVSGKKLMVSEVFLKAFTPWRTAPSIHRTERGKVNTAFPSLTQ